MPLSAAIHAIGSWLRNRGVTDAGVTITIEMPSELEAARACAALAKEVEPLMYQPTTADVVLIGIGRPIIIAGHTVIITGNAPAASHT